MIIYLDNLKYQYELDTIVRQFYPHGAQFESMESCRNDEVMIYQRGNSIFCEGKMQTFFSHEERIHPHENNPKNAYKRALYHVLCEKWDRKLDWGILSGIRPTKLYAQEYQRFGSAELTNKIFEQTYLLDPKKIAVLQSVYLWQEELLKDIQSDNYSIYVSVPFCPSKCNYCTFFSNDVAKKSKWIQPYLNALDTELKMVLQSDWVSQRKADTLYIGGGTPSSLTADELDSFLHCLNRYIKLQSLKEITFEAGRPDTIDREKLLILKKYGIDRISINPQTMIDQTLTKIGRNHTAQQIIDAYHLARSMNFNNINMDIILGLENENVQDIEYTLTELLRLDPDSITVHSLALKKASDLTKQISSESIARQYQEVYAMMGKVYERMQTSYKPYYLYRQKNIMGGQENIGFAKDNKSSLYNILIIEEYQNILSFGPGAISRFVYPKENRIERIANTKSLENYVEKIEEWASRKIAMFHELN